jgi:uncharacterized protein (DUF1499 family)
MANVIKKIRDKVVSNKAKRKEKRNINQVAREAKQAVIRTMPGTSKLEKRLNYAGAKARVRKAERWADSRRKESERIERQNQREIERGKKKAAKSYQKYLKKSDKEVKKATIASMPGTTMLEKRLNFAGAKARARKADRQESKRLEEQGPIQQTSRKIDVSTVKNSPGSNSNLDSDLGKSYIKYYNVDKTPKDRGTQQNTGKSETRVAFEKEFAAARSEGKDIFEFRGKKYNTKLKGEAMYGAKMKSIKKAKYGSKVKTIKKKK